MENPNRRFMVLEPDNPDHRRLIERMLAGETSGVAEYARRSLTTEADQEAIRAAEAKRARKALKLR